jgi:hypothetical protein
LAACSFSRRACGALRAGKLRVQSVPVNSAVPQTIRRNANQLAMARSKTGLQSSRRDCSDSTFCSFLWATRVSFLQSRKFLFVMKNKIHFFFLSIFRRVSTLKPAGEDENRAHVNKM